MAYSKVEKKLVKDECCNLMSGNTCLFGYKTCKILTDSLEPCSFFNRCVIPLLINKKA